MTLCTCCLPRNNALDSGDALNIESITRRERATDLKLLHAGLQRLERQRGLHLAAQEHGKRCVISAIARCSAWCLGAGYLLGADCSIATRGTPAEAGSISDTQFVLCGRRDPLWRAQTSSTCWLGAVALRWGCTSVLCGAPWADSPAREA